MLPTILTGPSVFEAAIDLRLAKSSSTFSYASDLCFRSLMNLYLEWSSTTTRIHLKPCTCDAVKGPTMSMCKRLPQCEGS